MVFHRSWNVITSWLQIIHHALTAGFLLNAVWLSQRTWAMVPCICPCQWLNSMENRVFRQRSECFCHCCVSLHQAISLLLTASILHSLPRSLWSNSLGSSVQQQQRLLLGHSHQSSRLVTADSKELTGLFSWWIPQWTKTRRYLIWHPKEKCLCLIVCGIYVDIYS